MDMLKEEQEDALAKIARASAWRQHFEANPANLSSENDEDTADEIIKTNNENIKANNIPTRASREDNRKPQQIWRETQRDQREAQKKEKALITLLSPGSGPALLTTYTNWRASPYKLTILQLKDALDSMGIPYHKRERKSYYEDLVDNQVSHFFEQQGLNKSKQTPTTLAPSHEVHENADRVCLFSLSFYIFRFVWNIPPCILEGADVTVVLITILQFSMCMFHL